MFCFQEEVYVWKALIMYFTNRFLAIYPHEGFFVLTFIPIILCHIASILMLASVHNFFPIDLTRAAARVDGLVSHILK